MVESEHEELNSFTITPFAIFEKMTSERNHKIGSGDCFQDYRKGDSQICKRRHEEYRKEFVLRSFSALKEGFQLLSGDK